MDSHLLKYLVRANGYIDAVAGGRLIFLAGGINKTVAGGYICFLAGGQAYLFTGQTLQGAAFKALTR